MTTNLELSRTGESQPVVRRRTSRLARHLQVWQLYLLIAIPAVLALLFNYIPILGNIIAFQDFSYRKGFLGSDFVGMKYFRQFFDMPIFWNILGNTVKLSLYQLAAGFPFPILLALAFNELTSQRAKKVIQTVTYAPYFISTVVMVSIVMQVLSFRYGIANELVKVVGGSPIDFMGSAALFRSIYVWSGIWQTAGYGAVLYIAALSSIDPSLYEAATIDGANRLQRILNIDLPGILPTIIITLILSTGSMLNVGFEKVFLLQNPANYDVSEIISTYVYKIGVKQAQFSLSTAIGLFNALVNFVILFTVNRLAKRTGETSLF